ncbi:helix-turn-helix domain-containing protein [Micromonospora tulbaghiae]|uniref:helix-turn-helix transcriptional regulator n=1 Tax=Micromonospora tulbaghiae TaxID=479978 RepID=UPI0033D29DB7
MIEGHLTTDDAAARLGIARQTLYNLAHTRDDFPKPLRIGRTLLWPAAGLDAWRRKHPARRKPPRGRQEQ